LSDRALGRVGRVAKISEMEPRQAGLLLEVIEQGLPIEGDWF